MTSLNLKKFDMAKIGKGSVVILIGKRNTGKSFLCKDLLYYKRDIPIGTVISATEGANKFYGTMMPSLFIHEEFRPEIVENLVKRQKIVVRKIQEQNDSYGKSNIDPWAYLIMDDLMYDTSWVKDKTIRQLFMNGRHYKLLFMITMQYSLGIPPALRSNVDYVFILRENIVSNRKRLYEHYAGMFPTFEIFCQVMDQCTSNFECLVIDNTTKSNKIEDMVYWYKADKHPEFKLGAPEFWQHHSNNYSNREEEDDDITKYGKRKNTPTINVKKNY
tara:strand:+ start:895 stop:1716 length:822 start_codon:yes stop_codon:yes gene_type:complete